MKVMQILKLKGSTGVETIAETASVAEAVGRLSAKGIGALVVTRDGGSMAGIVSERDIVRQIGREGATVLSQSVRGIMTVKVSTCEPGEDALEVLNRMTRGRFRHMPVLLRGQLAGILSIGDVVKARIEEIEAENEAMAHMLSGSI
ncbi:MAG: CBS domain-containing protein [Pseudomonadota bacterium]